MKIGFIDYYLDEWHANNYPAMIAELSSGNDIIVGAYALIDGPKGRLTTDEWCSKMGIPRYADVEKLINDSDALIVLSPDNPEMHEELGRLPLMSGKPVYMDKTFANDGDTARRLFALAEKYGTPLCSTSALRYATEYEGIDPDTVQAVHTWGPNEFMIYSIHQLEPIMMLIRSKAVRVMANVCEGCQQLVIEFEDSRRASLTMFKGGTPFVTNVASSAGNRLLTVKSEFFKEFLKHTLEFLRTGKTEITPSETISIMETRCAGIKALETPGVWVNV